MQTFITIDIGTTNWKVILFDHKGQALHTEKRPAKTLRASDGMDYYDPAAIWSAICQMCSDVFAKHSPREVAAVCATSMGESVVPIGANGEALLNIIPWFDTRSSVEAEQVVQAIGHERIFDITGTQTNPIYSLPKLLWTQKHAPALFEKARKWLQMCDYVNYRLSGRIATDHSMACRTLAYDINACGWSDSMLEPFGFSASLLPEILSAGSVLGCVTKEASLQTGIAEGTPVVMGGHDHPVACIGGNVFGGTQVFNSSGTAEPYLYVSEKGAPWSSKRLGQRVTRHPDPRRHITWGGIVASGVAVEWAVNLLTPGFQGSYNQLFARCSDVAPGARGLLFHPHLRGSGAPWWDAACRGAFLGLTAAHTTEDMLRSMLEGLCCQARIILDMHEALLQNVPIRTIRCLGGGSRISLWQSIKASLTGCTVQTNPAVEATPLGAAMLAATGVGLHPTLEEAAEALCPAMEEYQPDEQDHAAYQRIVALYRESYAALEEINHKLSAFSMGGPRG